VAALVPVWGALCARLERFGVTQRGRLQISDQPMITDVGITGHDALLDRFGPFGDVIRTFTRGPGDDTAP
jgi:hypothetical protein